MKNNKKKILIIEDDEVLGDIYVTKLEMEGFDANLATEGFKGVEEVIRNKPDLILLDIVLPNLNGFEILKKGDADVTTVQDKPTDGSYCPDRVQLIKDAQIINGVPFVRIEEVIACKKDYDRPKDREDIKNLEEYLAKH